MTKPGSLLLLLLFLLAIPLAASAADPFVSPFASSMSDDLYRQTAFNAGRSTGGDSFRPSFSTNDPARLTIFGRFPFGDTRYHRFPITDDVSLAWTHDQFGSSQGFSTARAPELPVLKDLLGLKDGTTRLGRIRENALTHYGQSRPTYGIYISYHW